MPRKFAPEMLTRSDELISTLDRTHDASEPPRIPKSIWNRARNRGTVQFQATDLDTAVIVRVHRSRLTAVQRTSTPAARHEPGPLGAGD